MPHRLLPVALLGGILIGLAACGILDPRPSAAPAAGAGQWRPGPAARQPLTQVAAAAHDGRIWVVGGLDAGGGAVASVQVFDPAHGTWDTGPSLVEPIHHAALVSDGERLSLVGGFGFDGQPRDRVWILQLAGGDLAWAEDRPLPEPRAAGAAAWDGAGRIVYAGGVGPDGVSADVLVQEDHGWRQLGELSEAREHLAATSDGRGSVFVLGGRRGDLDTNQATVDVVSRAGVRRLGELPTRRGGVAAFFWPAVGACLVGGESPGGTHGEVECIDASGTLTTLPSLRQPRHGLGAAVLDGVAYSMLGGPEPGLFVADTVESLTLP